MSDYPVLLNLEGRLCVVVGGGHVGLRKVRGLLEAGARVRLVDPAPARVPEGVEHLRRPYREGDLAGACLAFAASSDRRLNAEVAAAARRLGIPVNVADSPQGGDFTLPALLRRGRLSMAVATGGGSPALAAVLRDSLSEKFGPEWATILEILAALRGKRLTPRGNVAYNQPVLRRLLEAGLPALVAAGDAAAVDGLLRSVCGEGATLAQLGVHLPKGMK